MRMLLIGLGLLSTGSTVLSFPLFGDASTVAAVDSHITSRAAVSAGMGVEYVSAPDVVDYVNGVAGNLGATQRLPEFKAGVQFFGAIAIPLSVDWVMKVEYAYLLLSYTPQIIGASDFTLTGHMPSVVLQYVAWDEGLYDLKIGAGVGYHFATLATTYLTADERFNGHGIGTVIDLEANTAFGDHLFAYLGGDLRFEFIGTLKNSTLGLQNSGPQLVQPRMNTFSIGARFGLSYYF